MLAPCTQTKHGVGASHCVASPLQERQELDRERTEEHMKLSSCVSSDMGFPAMAYFLPPLPKTEPPVRDHVCIQHVILCEYSV